MKELEMRRRGILKLVTEELPRYHFSEESLQESATAMRKHSRSSQVIADLMTTTTISREQYIPSNSEFSLFFAGGSDNLNSIRFRPKLVEFCVAHKEEVQCICIPNRESDDLLLTGTGFFCLPWAHPNRSALLMLLGITQVPTVAVVCNQDGRRITDQGLAAIERNADGNSSSNVLLLERWRRKESGLTLLQWGGCSMS